MSHKKFGPDRFSRFEVYWIQTDRQAKFIYRFHSEKIFIISGVCLSGVCLVRSLSCQEFVLSGVCLSGVCLSGVCHGTI